MQLDTLTHGVELPSMSVHPIAEYWRPEVIEALRHQDWARADLRERIALAAWQGFVADLPRDPYVNLRWKRMSWLALNDQGEVEDMGQCPMAQGGAFNDAESMADRLRYYDPLTQAFFRTPRCQGFRSRLSNALGHRCARTHSDADHWGSRGRCRRPSSGAGDSCRWLQGA